MTFIALAILSMSILFCMKNEKKTISLYFPIMICSFILLYEIKYNTYAFNIHKIQMIPNKIGIFLALSSSFLTIIAIHLNNAYSIGMITSLYGIYKITCTTDFFNMYVGYEVLLAGFLLCLIKSKFRFWKKYLQYQMLASMLIFFGITYFYMEQGHLGIFNNINPSFSSYILLLGFLMKICIYPFGIWIKIYKKIPNDLVFWVAGLMTKVPLYSIIVLIPWCRQIEFIYFIAILSSIIGAILAYKSTDDKEILSFHIISQIGIMLIISVFEHSYNQKFGLTMLYMMHHIWTKSTLFATVNNKNSFLCKYAVFSLIGFPFTPGFVAKITALYFMISREYYSHALFLIISSLITAISMEKFMNKSNYDIHKPKEIFFYLFLLFNIILMFFIFKFLIY